MMTTLTMRLSDDPILEATSIGQRIRFARERKGWSQVELAHALNLGQRAISELEQGKRRLTVQEAATVAKLLDVPLLTFFEDTDLHPTDLDLSLLKAFHALPNDKLRRAAIQLIQSISETLNP
jgi:transcriptional regulator with XRE-family HTH domain